MASLEMVQMRVFNLKYDCACILRFEVYNVRIFCQECIMNTITILLVNPLCVAEFLLYIVKHFNQVVKFKKFPWRDLQKVRIVTAAIKLLARRKSATKRAIVGKNQHRCERNTKKRKQDHIPIEKQVESVRIKWVLQGKIEVNNEQKSQAVKKIARLAHL